MFLPYSWVKKIQEDFFHPNHRTRARRFFWVVNMCVWSNPVFVWALPEFIGNPSESVEIRRNRGDPRNSLVKKGFINTNETFFFN